MIFVTAATGARHISLAERLDRSLAAWDWPRLLVLAGREPDVGGWIEAADDIGAGRGLKTRWATALPDDYEGPAAWIDADCEAVGPWLQPDIRPGEVAAVDAGRVEARPPFLLVHSTAICTGDAGTARSLCKAWASELQALPCRSDEPALVAAIRRLGIRQKSLGMTSGRPFPNLIHRGATNPAAGVGDTISEPCS